VIISSKKIACLRIEIEKKIKAINKTAARENG